MEWIEYLLNLVRNYIPLLGVTAVLVLVLSIAHRILMVRPRTDRDSRFGGQLAMLALTGIGVIVVILALPVETATRGQLLSLLGLLLTAMIAISSTTFVANAMGGLMLRAMNNFRPGDFVEVNGQFGRVTERGLFHTEIQNEDRDLTTVPNLILVTSPVRVLRESGTIVSAHLSLGYEVSHDTIEPLLERAATNSGLSDPFVQILELQDHAVVYRVAGFLREVKYILSARSQLRRSVLDTLHAEGIEIVSPSFMNQRRVDEDRFVPTTVSNPLTPAPTDSPDALVFDKAERAERVDDLRAELASLEEEQGRVSKASTQGDDPAERRARQRSEELSRRADSLRAQIEMLLDRDES